MEKRVFILPEVEVVKFDSADILTESTGTGTGTGTGSGSGGNNITTPDDEW